MAINPSAAASAYTQAMKTIASPGNGAAASTPGSGESFADMVKDVVGQAIQTGKSAESTALSGAGNKAELTDVVTAITNAELSLQTVVAVRDKVIAAYQDIMKMPI